MAPILLFTYNRLDTLQKTVEALKQNPLSADSSLYIFSDGPKREAHASAVASVRSYLRTINGFASVNIIESPVNKGLARSIIDGVSQIISRFGKAIILEDDLITSPNFLSFMNQALDFYEKNPKVFNVSGFSFPIKTLGPDSVYFTMRASSWSWATWADRWSLIDWEVKDYADFRKNRKDRRHFRKMGSDLTLMLDRQMRGDIDSWAIRWTYHQFRRQLYTACPVISKVENIGYQEGATNTLDRAGRFKTLLDVKGGTSFSFPDKVQLSGPIIRQFTKHYSVRTRIKYKILNLIIRK
jgi:hypothetical protein